MSLSVWRVILGVVTYSPYPHLPYSAFAQACRAFRPTDLVPAIAAMSARLGEPPYSDRLKARMPPWGLAAAARESLLRGNEHRSKPADEAALLDLMAKFQIAGDVKPSEAGDEGFLVRMMTNMTYEQFPYQESMFEEVSRSHAWLIDGLPDVETKVISESSLTAMLDGITLGEAIGATFLLHVGALHNAGLYMPQWLDQSNFVDVLDVYPRTHIEKTAARLTTTPDEFRLAYNAVAVGTDRAARYDYNPLVATPFVDMGDGNPVAPATRLILRTVTPGGLYYPGIAMYDNDFANDLGLLFEHYVGRQLKLIDGARVEPEIAYGKGGGEKSVDWFVLMPNLVVLVEVKSSRLGPAARAGEPGLMESLQNSLGRARKQLARTVTRLAEGHPAFSDIPTGQPILGLIVTAEPFYTGSAYLLDHDRATIPGGPLPDVPVAVASARTVEMLVTHGADAEAVLLDAMARRSEDGVVNLYDIGNKPGQHNQILEDAWNSYPWPSPDAAGSEQV